MTTASWKQNINNSTFQAPSTSAKQQHWLPRGDKAEGEGGNKGHRCTSGDTNIIKYHSPRGASGKTQPSNCWISQVVGNQFINYCKQQEIPSFVVSDLFFHYRFFEIITDVFLSPQGQSPEKNSCSFGFCPKLSNFFNAKNVDLSDIQNNSFTLTKILLK